MCLANCLFLFHEISPQLQFDLFSIEESQDCQYDNLNVIFNASSSTAAPQRYAEPVSGMLIITQLSTVVSALLIGSFNLALLLNNNF